VRHSQRFERPGRWRARGLRSPCVSLWAGEGFERRLCAVQQRISLIQVRPSDSYRARERQQPARETIMEGIRIIGVVLLLVALASPARGQAKDAQKILSWRQYYDYVQTIDEKKYTLDADRFLELSKQKDTVVLDLRSEREYKQGHIEGAILFGADISQKNLETIVPSKDTTILLYCANSLIATRMSSLTDTTLPQFLLLGYKKTYKLKTLWREKDEDYRRDLKSLPMTGYPPGWTP
jgi:hypothetical protein